MLTFKLLSGSAAGREITTGRFPFSIGRQPGADLQSKEPGVWDHHASLILDPDTPGFRINAGASALLLVNGEPSLTSRIRNGDILDLGNLRIACWLSPVRQRPLHLREAAVAVLIAAVFAAQFWILYRLP